MKKIKWVLIVFLISTLSFGQSTKQLTDLEVKLWIFSEYLDALGSSHDQLFVSNFLSFDSIWSKKEILPKYSVALNESSEWKFYNFYISLENLAQPADINGILFTSIPSATFIVGQRLIDGKVIDSYRLKGFSINDYSYFMREFMEANGCSEKEMLKGIFIDDLDFECLNKAAKNTHKCYTCMIISVRQSYAIGMNNDYYYGSVRK